MTIRPFVIWPLLAIVSIFVSGCGDAGVAPSLSPMPVGAPNPDVIVDWVAEDSLSADFTVTPSGGAFTLGKHAIFFPANAICDPAVSSYGVTEWDAPCAPLTGPIQIHAEIRDRDGISWVDFTPSLRFVPTADPYQYVWLYLKVPGTADPSVPVQSLRIMWAEHLDGAGVDEAASDPTLATYFWRDGEILFRRIKHFSGYFGSALSDLEEVSGLVREIAF